MLKDDDVWHFMRTKGTPQPGDTVQGMLNWERRYKNMKYHSGGHIVDFALYLLGYSPKQLQPLKGDHGKKPFIVYQGVLHADIREALQTKVDELVEKDLAFSWDFQSLTELEMEAIYLQPGLPKNKPLRTLRLETVGAVADGGTHVHSTKEVGKILIPKIETRGENTIVYYTMQ